MPEQSPSVLEDSATHENIHIHEHEEHASEAIDLGHNNHHVLLHHPQKDGHTWTPLPTLDRVNCHRVFEKPRQVVSKDDAVKVRGWMQAWLADSYGRGMSRLRLLQPVFLQAGDKQ